MSLEYGTTVLSPSLPPESCTTTRILSLATVVPLSASANAIFCTNMGTVPPSDSTPSPPNPTRSNSRRDVFILAPVASGQWPVVRKFRFTGQGSLTTGHRISRQLIFRRRHHDVQHIAHLAVDAFAVQHPSLGVVVPVAVHVVDQFIARAVGKLTIQEHAGIRIDHFVGRFDIH